MSDRCQGRIQLAHTNFVPCDRRGTREHEGRLYCSQHDPSTRADRLAKQDRKRRVERAAPELLEALKPFANLSTEDVEALGLEQEVLNARAVIDKAE